MWNIDGGASDDTRALNRVVSLLAVDPCVGLVAACPPNCRACELENQKCDVGKCDVEYGLDILGLCVGMHSTAFIAVRSYVDNPLAVVTER